MSTRPQPPGGAGGSRGGRRATPPAHASGRSDHEGAAAKEDRHCRGKGGGDGSGEGGRSRRSGEDGGVRGRGGILRGGGRPGGQGLVHGTRLGGGCGAAVLCGAGAPPAAGGTRGRREGGAVGAVGREPTRGHARPSRHHLGQEHEEEQEGFRGTHGHGVEADGWASDDGRGQDFFRAASSNFLMNFAVSFLKSFRQLLQQNRNSRPSTTAPTACLASSSSSETTHPERG